MRMILVRTLAAEKVSMGSSSSVSIPSARKVTGTSATSVGASPCPFGPRRSRAAATCLSASLNGGFMMTRGNSTLPRTSAAYSRKQRLMMGPNR